MKVFGKICGPIRNYVSRKWRKLHNKKLHDFYKLPGIVRLTRQMRLRLAGYVASMEKQEMGAEY
jgi:hypothetical protein